MFLRTLLLSALVLCVVLMLTLSNLSAAPDISLVGVGVRPTPTFTPLPGPTACSQAFCQGAGNQPACYCLANPGDPCCTPAGPAE